MMKPKTLILGHSGMLGDMVSKFYDFIGFNVIHTNTRWPSAEFCQFIKETECDVIINCIGTIPQKSQAIKEYSLCNTDLPIWLDKNSKSKIIWPTTDCEYSGELIKGKFYEIKDIRNAQDEYGKSKADASIYLESHSVKTKIIRTSIIGLEANTNYSLLNWFLAQDSEVNGFINHYWNGITTLEWAKQSLSLLLKWNERPLITQIGLSEAITKYDMLKIFSKCFDKQIKINKYDTPVVNKALLPIVEAKDLESQVQELIRFSHLKKELLAI